MKRNISSQFLSPAARPSGKHAQPPLSCEPDTERGRARPWLKPLCDPGLVALASGWGLSILGVAADAACPGSSAAAITFVAAMFSFGFAASWFVRNDIEAAARGRRNGGSRGSD